MLLWKKLWISQRVITSAMFLLLSHANCLWVEWICGMASHLLGFYFALYCLVSGLIIAGVFPVPVILHCVHHSCDSFSQQCLLCRFSFLSFRTAIFSWICSLSRLKQCIFHLKKCLSYRRPLQVKYSKEHSLVCNSVNCLQRGNCAVKVKFLAW